MRPHPEQPSLTYCTVHDWPYGHGPCRCRPCPACEPAAGDPLGEMARDWLNSYSYPDHLNENMRGLLRAAFERLVREDAAVPLSMRCSEQPCPCFDCKVLEGVSDGILARYGLKEER